MTLSPNPDGPGYVPWDQFCPYEDKCIRRGCRRLRDSEGDCWAEGIRDGQSQSAVTDSAPQPDAETIGPESLG